MTPDHVEVLLKHGVRRISMGIQSTDDAVLAKVAEGAAAWATAHPSDMAEIQGVVDQARVAQVCRRAQP